MISKGILLRIIESADSCLRLQEIATYYASPLSGKRQEHIIAIAKEGDEAEARLRRAIADIDVLPGPSR